MKAARRLKWCPVQPPFHLAAFTLIEVLVVVAIIALLISILLPSLTLARAQAKQTQCGSNVHQQCTSYFMYAADFRGLLPPNPTQGKWNAIRGAYVTDSPPYFYVNSIVAVPIDYDQRRIFKKYAGRNMNIFTCPANGGPPIDDPLVERFATTAYTMLGHYDHFYNSTCVFKNTSLERPWAPSTDWREGGSPGRIPIIQDEYTAGGGPSLSDPGTIFNYNHGPGRARSSMGNRYTEFGNWPQSYDRGGCVGVNVGFLDGHTQWVKNMRIGPGTRWTLDMPWSQASTRPLATPSENPLQGGGAVLTIQMQLKPRS